MRRVAALWGLLAAGCGGNPYDTSADRSRYEEMSRRDLERRIFTTASWPQARAVPFAAPDLEGWRDTVLATASEETLQHLRDDARRKCAWLEARCGDLARQDPINREPEFTARLHQWQTERTRLKMIEDRLSTGAPRRTD